MGYSHLLSFEVSLATFRVAYDIPKYVDIAYCHQGDIEIQRRHGTNTVFFPFMAIIKGGIRFPVNPLVIGTLRFYGLCPDQLPPNFFRVVSCVKRLNQLFGLQLDHHDINFMYNLCSNIESDYYLKTRDNRVWLISCLPDSNRNSSSNWLAGELLYAFKSRDVGRFRVPFYFHFTNLHISTCLVTSNHFLHDFCVDTKRFKKDLRVIHVRDLNFVLRLEIFVHWDGQL